MAKVLADPTGARTVCCRPGRSRSATRPREFAAQFKADIARFAKIIDEAKIPKLD